mmetsp:Transcript_101534/g.327677  ORF Transcript_101534/g.327677 Transcript_101534/m.327677 type:complete len:220 (+) Transcript_101534:178-837(+)
MQQDVRLLGVQSRHSQARLWRVGDNPPPRATFRNGWLLCNVRGSCPPPAADRESALATDSALLAHWTFLRREEARSPATEFRGCSVRNSCDRACKTLSPPHACKVSRAASSISTSSLSVKGRQKSGFSFALGVGVPKSVGKLQSSLWCRLTPAPPTHGRGRAHFHLQASEVSSATSSLGAFRGSTWTLAAWRTTFSVLLLDAPIAAVRKTELALSGTRG